MRTLTTYQKNFLTEKFFCARVSGSEKEGIIRVADKLLTDGKVIVANVDRLEKLGGIWNFVKFSPAQDAIDCYLLRFDLEYFLESNFFLEHKDGGFMKELCMKSIELAKEYSELTELFSYSA